MIYVLGDSFSFGYNFWLENKPNRNELLYSHFLSKKLNSPVKNLSVPGSSNWRISRILNNLNLSEDDYVIIAWSSNDRSETGFSKNSLFPKDTQYNIKDLENISFENDYRKIVHGFEKDGNIITAKLLPSLYINGLENIDNHLFRQYVNINYEHFFNPDYLENMFLVCFNSAVYKCIRSKCKFIMFNVFWKSYSRPCDLLNIPEYYLGYDNNMSSILRPNTKPKRGKFGLDYWTEVYTNSEYWNEEEHKKVADLLYNQLQELYP